jgi:hypothetical protein
MRALADSFLSFNRKKYNEVIENLSHVRFFDTRDKFYVRSLSLRAYYELGELVLLDYNIDSAKQFVSKNPTLGKLTRKNFSSFLNYLKRLLTIREKNEFSELEKLLKEIEQDKGTINREWLQEKINEIIKKGAA